GVAFGRSTMRTPRRRLAARTLFTLGLALALFSWLRAAQPPGRIRAEPGEMRPGLIATYRSLIDRDATFTRIDRKPVFSLGHSNPDGRLPHGPFEVLWTGLLQVQDSGPITFDAFAGGELSVEVDGVGVLKGKGASETTYLKGIAPIERKFGHYRITIRFRA